MKVNKKRNYYNYLTDIQTKWCDEIIDALSYEKEISEDKLTDFVYDYISENNYWYEDQWEMVKDYYNSPYDMIKDGEMAPIYALDYLVEQITKSLDIEK